MSNIESSQTIFSSGAVRDSDHNANGSLKGRYDLLPHFGIQCVAEHCQYGAEHYGEHNVDLGIPVSNLLCSALRHINQIFRGDYSEDSKLPYYHYRAAAWNCLWALEMVARNNGLVDVPWEPDTDSLNKEFRNGSFDRSGA